MTAPQIRKAYDPPVRVQKNTVGKTRTQQSFIKECDINNIMSKYSKSGLLTHVKEYEGQYGDFTADISFHDAMCTVVKTREMFESLPAAIRQRFFNDPGQFLEFVQDPANAQEMREMGLIPTGREAKVQEPVEDAEASKEKKQGSSPEKPADKAPAADAGAGTGD